MKFFNLKCNNAFPKNSISRFALTVISILVIVFLQISPSYAKEFIVNDTLKGKNINANKPESIESLLKRNEKNSILLFKENKINREHNLLFDAIYKNIQMNSEVNLLNKRFKDALDSISKLQIIGSNFKYDLQNDIIETDNIRKNEFTNLLSPDGEIFKPSSNKMSFYESFFYSLSKGLIVLIFFISNH